MVIPYLSCFCLCNFDHHKKIQLTYCMAKNNKTEANFEISIYPKGGNRAGVVFRRNKVCYRLTTIEKADHFITELKKCIDLTRSKIINLFGPKNRRWVVEVAGEAGQTALVVWEMIAEGKVLLRFQWKGSEPEFNAALPL